MGRRYLVWFWSGGGGGSQFAARLAQRLGKRFGADNVVASLREDDPTVEWAQRRGVRVLAADVVSDRKRPLRTAADLLKGAHVLRQHIEQTAPDAVILAMNFAAAAPLSMALNVPLYYCAHDPKPHAGDYAVRLQSATQAFLLRRAEKVVALSGFGARQLREQGVDASKIVTVPLASVFDPQLRAPRTEQGPVQFLFVGRMITYKGLDILARALRTISHRDDWRLRLAGKGPALNKTLLSELALPQVDVVSRDWMGHDEIDDLFVDSDVLLAPYREATQSGVIADALTWGVPAVATPVGALPEQLGEGRAGWIARDASVSGFADALQKSLQDRDELAAKAALAHRLATQAWTDECWEWLGPARPSATPHLALVPGTARQPESVPLAPLTSALDAGPGLAGIGRSRSSTA